MGCTSSKENTNPPSTATIITDNNQLLINEQFRKWLQTNRPKADEYVLNDILSTTKQTHNTIDDYRPIVRKALDLLSERTDIKTINKLNKILQKEVSLASPKKVSHTIDILKQTAEKLRHGQISFDTDQQQPQQQTTTNGEITNNTKTSDSKHNQISSSGEPGIALKEALEKARILFYKGKQAAIFANPSGGYDVRVIDENDHGMSQDGNLLRSIIVTEVKMRPKSVSPSTTTTTNLPHFIPPPPPPTKLLDENEIGEDFRRSIDAALKGLESIYQTSPKNSKENHQENLNEDNNNINQEKKENNEAFIRQVDIQPKLVSAIDDMNEILVDTVETMSGSQIGDAVAVHDDDNQRKENLHTNQSSSLDDEKSVTSPQPNAQLKNENRPESFHTTTGHNHTNSNKQTSFDETEENSLKSTNKIAEQSSTSIAEYNKTLSESILPSAVSSNDMNNTTLKSPSHNVTYTEIIQSESQDGEQSRRFVTESYDDLPSNDDEQTTTLKVITKSEFSNHPALGEKIMEQSVQIITVKVRNETTTMTNSSQLSENDISNDK